jgi:hypothetical protein
MTWRPKTSEDVPCTRQEAYDYLTHVSYLWSTQHRPVPMEFIKLLDDCQHIIRLESRLAGNEVQ